MHRAPQIAWSLPALLLLLAVAGGCGDVPFDPFEPTERAFSIYGFLDAGADTQYVRVTALRQQFAQDPTPPAAQVLLEDLTTGQQIRLRDSLFRFGLTEVAFNYWTDTPLTPGGTYRLTVTRADGVQSSATTTLPPAIGPLDLRLPTGFGDPNQFRQGIIVPEVERLVDLRVIYTGRRPGSNDVFRRDVFYTDHVGLVFGNFAAQFNAYADFRAPFAPTCPEVLSATAFAAAGGPDWPDLEGADLETLARADVVANVENGVGFLGGIYSVRAPWPELVDFMNGRQRACASS